MLGARRTMPFVAALVSLALPAVAAADADADAALKKPPLPDRTYFSEAGRHYVFDAGAALAARDAFVRSHEGCLEVSILRAVLPQDEAASAVPPAVAGGLRQLGASPEEVRATTGHDLRGVAWEPVISHRLCAHPGGFVVDHRTRTDRVAYALPWEIVGSSGDPIPADLALEVSVNGHRERIPAADALRMATRLARGEPAGETPARELEALALHAGPSSTYPAALDLLLRQSRELAERYDWEDPSPAGSPCWWPCTKCGLYAGGLIVGGTATLAASCGATLGAGCVAGGVGYIMLAAAVLDQCMQCCVCYNACDVGPGPKPGPVPSPGDPGNPEGTCPEGYHECCNNLCCSDSNPPTSCP